jgi:hypothetical protein
MQIDEQKRWSGKMKLGGSGGATGLGGRIMPLQSISCATRMGKGLWEPVPPYRQAYVFGADLGVPNANSWNAVPEAMNPTNSFDLSQLTLNHEVVVAMLAAFDVPAGPQYSIEHKWYRDRDGALLFSTPYSIPDAASYGYSGWAWYYVYSYIGYVPWEIYENGGYHVDLTFLISSVPYFSQRLAFIVTGIPSAPQVSGFKISDFVKA